jgi:hypothetical protein
MSICREKEGICEIEKIMNNERMNAHSEMKFGFRVEKKLNVYEVLTYPL